MVAKNRKNQTTMTNTRKKFTCLKLLVMAEKWKKREGRERRRDDNLIIAPAKITRPPGYQKSVALQSMTSYLQCWKFLLKQLGTAEYDRVHSSNFPVADRKSTENYVGPGPMHYSCNQGVSWISTRLNTGESVIMMTCC